MADLQRHFTSETRAYRPAWAWTGERFEQSPVIAVDGSGAIVPHHGERVRERAGILVPGLINAHTHLELPRLQTPAELGLSSWVRMMRAGPVPSAAQAGAGVFQSISAGVAGVGEITNSLASVAAIRAAGLQAQIWHEFFGIDVENVPETPGRLTAHAPHTTHPAIIRRAAALSGPWSIHFDEDPQEAVFLRTGGGEWPAHMRRSGRDLSRVEIPGVSPAEYLSALGVLSPRACLVHATCTRGTDLDILAASGANILLCPRSNMHITGQLPDVEGILARGIPIGIGTDSLASSPDLDVLAEAAALAKHFPRVQPEVWMRALTAGGASAIGLGLGRLEAHPGLLLVDAPDPCSLFDGTRWRRRWLACP